MDLVRRKIDVDHQDRYGHTALLYLCSKPNNPQCIELAELILKAGANPDIKNNDGRTPLYLMVSNMNSNYMNSGVKYEMIQLLLRYGADKNLKCGRMSSVEVAEEIWDKRAMELLASDEGK